MRWLLAAILVAATFSAFNAWQHRPVTRMPGILAPAGTIARHLNCAPRIVSSSGRHPYAARPLFAGSARSLGYPLSLRQIDATGSV